MERFCNGKIVLLLRCINRQLRHPISEDVLRVRLPHRVSVGAAVYAVPPAFKPRIPRFDGGLFTVVKRPFQRFNIWFFQRRQFPEEDGHVDFRGAQQTQEVVHQRFVVLLQTTQAQFLRPRFALGVHGEFHAVVQYRLKSAHIVEQRRNGFQEAGHVPGADVGLVAVPVPAVAGVGGVWRPVDIKRFQPSVGSVVDGDAVNGHVVGVHYAVDEAHAHPVGDHRGGSLGHFGHPSDEAVVVVDVVLGEVVTDGVFNERSEGIVVAVRHVDLERAEPDETRRHPADDGARFWGRVAVVENVPHHLFPRRDQRQRTRGWDTKVVHGLAAEVFPYGGAQHGFAVRCSGIGCQSGTFELQFPEPVVHFHFAQSDGSPITQLPCPIAELMPAVALGVRRHSRNDRAASQHFGATPFQAECLSHLGTPQGESWGRGRRRGHFRPTRTRHLPWSSTDRGVTRRFVQKTAMPPHGLKRCFAHKQRDAKDLFNIMGRHRPSRALAGKTVSKAGQATRRTLGKPVFPLFLP